MSLPFAGFRCSRCNTRGLGLERARVHGKRMRNAFFNFPRLISQKLAVQPMFKFLVSAKIRQNGDVEFFSKKKICQTDF